MGEYILTEGEELTSTSKFYLVQSGTVECFKQFNVSTTQSSVPSAALQDNAEYICRSGVAVDDDFSMACYLLSVHGPKGVIVSCSR